MVKFIFDSFFQSTSAILVAEANLRDEDSDSSVEIIYPDHSRINQLPTLPSRFSACFAFVLDGELMLIGQYSPQHGSYSQEELIQMKSECLKLVNGSWSHHSHCNSRRLRHSACQASTKDASFVFGGYPSPQTFEYLSKNSSKWEVGQNIIPNGILNGYAITISNEEIWLIGGALAGDDRTPIARILSFDTRDHSFETLDMSLIEPRMFHSCAFVPGTDTIIITGGCRGNSLNLWPGIDFTETIDIRTKTVIPGPPIIELREASGIGILRIQNQDRVVIFGGSNEIDEDEGEGERYLDSIEVYYPERQAWIPANFKLKKYRPAFGFATIKSSDIF